VSRGPKPTPSRRPTTTLDAATEAVRTGTAILAPSPFQGGQLVAGRYLVHGRIAEGGMATVYRASDTELDETVALKVPHLARALEPDVLERLRWEVKLARRVTHANVARVYDLADDRGLRFLTMEFIEGQSLADHARALGLLSADEMLRIVAQVAAGLQAAHDAGVVHRDLKPENILIARHGRVALTDFGIACEGRPPAGPHEVVHATGTPAYMAPEQVAGRSIDGRADIYALGTIMFELLTGTLAWTGEHPLMVAHARLVEPPPDPRRWRPDLADRVAELIMGCMAVNREDRPASARTLTEDLSRAIASAQAVAPRPGRSPAPAAPPTAARPEGAPAASSPPRRTRTGPTTRVGRPR
jgi:serine/threonine-protein kinase